MNISEVTALMTSSRGGVSQLGLRQQNKFLSQDSGFVRKFKMAQESAHKIIYHIGMEFPFAPFTGEEDTFNVDRNYLSPVSPTSTVLAIKEAMRKDPILHTFYAKKVGKTAEEYDITEDKVTEADKEVFHRYRKPMHYSALTQQCNFEAYGQYGRKHLCEVETNENGTVISASRGYYLALLERDLYMEDRKRVAEEYAVGGPKYGQSEKDMKADLKAAKLRIRITEPRLTGILTHLAFEIDFVANTFKDIAAVQKSPLANNSYWTSGAKDELVRVKQYLGGVVDTNFDFIEVDVILKSLDDVSEAEKALEAFKRRDFQSNPRDPICKAFPKFPEIYRTFRDDPANFDERKIFNAIPAFNKPTEEALLEHYKSEFAVRMHLLTDRSAVTHQKLVSALSPEAESKALDAAMSGVKGNLQHSVIDKESMVGVETGIDDMDDTDNIDINSAVNEQGAISLSELK